MLPSNVDPRRADRVVRQKPTMNANGQAEDLTPDYMNILGQRATTANATAETSSSSDRHIMVDGNTAGSGIGGQSANESHNINQTQNSVGEEVDSTTTNVIPTSPQYGVAIIPNQAPIITTATITSDITTETITLPTDTITDTQVKQVTDDGKDIHSTPSRNDRFKVVKIASLEPFKRGRWKCMDYVDEAPPPAALQQQQQQQQQQPPSQQQQQNKVTQSSGNIPVAGGGIYLQTQSLPQQQIQQMLLQGGYTNGTQFYPNVPTQMIPQTQYFYPPGTNLQTTQTLPQQLINTSGVPTSNIPTQFINTTQPYFTGVVSNSVGYPIPTNYQNVQYVPANMMQQNQNSAFVSTSQPNVQLPTNFQQNQTYAGQANVNQQPMVNGHAYPTQNEQPPPPQQQQQQQQQNTASLPAQTAKNVILNNVQQPVVSQPQISQPNIQSNQIPVVQNNTQPQTVPIIQPQQQNQVFQQQQQQQQPQQQQQQPPPPQQQQQTNFQQVPPQQQQVISGTSQPIATSQNYDQANNVYTNPQFDMNVNSLTVLEGVEQAVDTINNNNNNNETNIVDAAENTDDPSKTNPVVNAIDNKIEQAMDLVKSHLMYTVREEVEVLKEKIAELMERIQQLETENNFLRSQIPKSQTIPSSVTGGTIQQPTPTITQPPPPQQQQQTSSTSSAPSNLPTETNPPQQ